jgi:hypothetical protein
MSDFGLDGYYLVRAYYEGADPFAVVTDMPCEKLTDIFKKATPERVEGPNRGCDDYDYMERRTEIENWLRDGARAIGVDIRKENPVYFALTRDPEAFARDFRWGVDASLRSERKFIVIPVSEVDLSTCTFTHDDSFISHKVFAGRLGSVPHPLQGIVFNTQQIVEALKTYGEPGELRYIEAQMWDRPSAAVKAAAKTGPPVKHANGQSSMRP